MSSSTSISTGAGLPALSVSVRKNTWRESRGILASSLRLTMGKSSFFSPGSISAMGQITRWVSRVWSSAMRALS